MTAQAETGENETPEDAAETASATSDTVQAENTGVDAADGDDAADADPLAELQAKVDENWNLYLRAAAEIENVRKRAARDVEHVRKFALEGFARDLLEVRDSLELGLAAAESADAEALRAGSESTLKLLTGVLERNGVEQIDPEGEPFDPERHEAMTMQPSPEAEPGSVLTVVQKGYILNGRLLRPARVVVAAESTPSGSDDS